MDFTKLGGLLDEQETWLHLEVGGKPLYLEDGMPSITKTDKPTRVRLRGVSAPAVVNYLKAIERAQLAHRDRVSRASDKEIDRLAKRFQDSMDSMMTKAVAASIVDWENVNDDGEKPTPESIDALVNPATAPDDRAAFIITAIRGQIYAHITEQRQLFTDAARA